LSQVAYELSRIRSLGRKGKRGRSSQIPGSDEDEEPPANRDFSADDDNDSDVELFERPATQPVQRRRGRPKKNAAKVTASTPKGRTTGSRSVNFIWDDYVLMVRVANKKGGFGRNARLAFMRTLEARRKTVGNTVRHLDNFPIVESSAHRKLQKEWDNFGDMMQSTEE
jgi:hypothetical protein